MKMENMLQRFSCIFFLFNSYGKNKTELWLVFRRVITCQSFQTVWLSYVTMYEVTKPSTSNHQVKTVIRSSPSEVLWGKGVLQVCSKFTGKHPCRSAISIKLQSNFIEIALQHGCFPVNVLHIFRTPFLKNTSGWLLL